MGKRDFRNASHGKRGTGTESISRQIPGLLVSHLIFSTLRFFLLPRIKKQESMTVTERKSAVVVSGRSWSLEIKMIGRFMNMRRC